MHLHSNALNLVITTYCTIKYLILADVCTVCDIIIKKNIIWYQLDYASLLILINIATSSDYQGSHVLRPLNIHVKGYYVLFSKNVIT